MKRIRILVLTLLLVHLSVSNAQVAKWLIPPKYDDIGIITGADLIISDSANYSSLWTFEGKHLAKTQGQIWPFVEHLAVTTERGGNAITGFFKENGDYVKLSDCSVANLNPYFSDGFLLVKQKGFLKFVDTSGVFQDGTYIKAYPFFNGYASCMAYQNMLKMKDPYSILLDKNQEDVIFSYNNKTFYFDDIDFVSSVNDEGIGIVIAKHKVYYFNGKKRSLSPVYFDKNETNIKNQAKLDKDLSECLQPSKESSYTLTAKCGKSDYVTIKFNSMMLPVSIITKDGEYTYRKETIKEKQYESSLRLLSGDDLFGLKIEDSEVLPPQFKRIKMCFDDKAIVELAGKYGLLDVDKDDNFKLTINKGNDIAFRHQKFETTIRLDIPIAISAFDTRLDVDPSFGCEVDMTSSEQKNTEFGNYLQYNCVLTIPPLLPDEMYGNSRNEIIYPIRILYDGLKSPLILFKVKAWHYKYFNIDVNNAETNINKGDLTFTFDINAERNPGETVYPISINIVTDSLDYEQEKISEIRYKYKVFGLKEGVNNLTIQILEQGCPPTSFPFEITYSRQSAKRKENLVIKKKVSNSPSPTPKPHIDI